MNSITGPPGEMPWRIAAACPPNPSVASTIVCPGRHAKGPGAPPAPSPAHALPTRAPVPSIPAPLIRIVDCGPRIADWDSPRFRISLHGPDCGLRGPASPLRACRYSLLPTLDSRSVLGKARERRPLVLQPMCGASQTRSQMPKLAALGRMRSGVNCSAWKALPQVLRPHLNVPEPPHQHEFPVDPGPLPQQWGDEYPPTAGPPGLLFPGHEEAPAIAPSSSVSRILELSSMAAHSTQGKRKRLPCQPRRNPAAVLERAAQLLRHGYSPVIVQAGAWIHPARHPRRPSSPLVMSSRLRERNVDVAARWVASSIESHGRFTLLCPSPPIFSLEVLKVALHVRVVKPVQPLISSYPQLFRGT